jgi:hypothetical protein
MLKKTYTKTLSIPCPFKSPVKFLGKPKKPNTSNFSSRGVSPLHNNLKKFLIPAKSITRQHSPKDSLAILSFKKIKPKVPSHKVKPKKPIQKPTQNNEKLSTLKGKQLMYAPKIFENQIFSDVYDENGKHDRIMEIQITEESISTYSPKFLCIDLDLSRSKDQGPKPPGNSFEETRQDTCTPFSSQYKFDLFTKLSVLAKDLS